jgi:rubrerythrin
MTTTDPRTGEEIRPPASPVCYAAELAPEPMSTTEAIAFLNNLLEGERAGAQGLAAMAKHVGDGPVNALLLDVARDEGRYCVMLRAHIERLGGEASKATGVFFEKLMAREGLAAKLKLLDRGQSAVVRAIDEALPRIDDAALAADLVEMREVHVQNIARCNAVSL